MQHQDDGARGDFLTAAKLQSELIATSGLSLKCPWSEQKGKPSWCKEAGLQIQPPPSLLQADVAGWKNWGKVNEIMPKQSTLGADLVWGGMHSMLMWHWHPWETTEEQSPWEVVSAPISLETSELNTPVRCRVQLYSSGRGRVTTSSRVYRGSPRQGEQIMQNLADGDDQLLKWSHSWKKRPQKKYLKKHHF